MGGRAAALVAGALLLSALVLPWRPETLCLLRGLTGVPCPLCGSTTALVHLGGGDLPSALRASPLVVLGAPLWVLWPLVGPPVRALARPGSRLRSTGGAAALVLAGSELWQLQRVLG